MRIRTALGTLMAAAVAACHDSTAPPAFVGRYHLVALDGVPVPTAIGTGIVLQSGWLSLDAGSAWMFSRTQRADASAGPPSVDTLSGQWAASGNDITLYFASTSVVQATATYAPGAVVVTYASKRYSFVPD